MENVILQLKMRFSMVFLQFSMIPCTLFYFATGETGLDRKKNVVVKGLHNWYQFHLEQAAGRLTYTPPPKNTVDTNKKVMASCCFLSIRLL